MKTFKSFFLFLLIFSISNFVSGQNSSLGDTLGAWNAGILTPTPDRALRGIEFAEGYFWATGSDPDDLWQHKLYKFSADGQTLVEYWEYGIEFAGWGDLAYDGEYLWVTDVDTIRQLDMETGQKTGVWFKTPQYYNAGLAYDPATDHFWVSGDNNVISEVDRDGNIVNTVPFIPDYPAAGLAWDTWTPGGPYLWIWSMKYTPSDVRPEAYQLFPETGVLTNVTFEGVLMNPQAPYAADGALGATITDQLIPGKVTFVGMHSSSYQQYNDQMDWVVYYDLDPEGQGVPGPEISVLPASIQNDLLPGDSIDVPVFISNLSEEYTLNWLAALEYPGMNDTTVGLGDTLLTFDATALTAPDTNRKMRSIAYAGDYIYISTGVDFNDQFKLYKIKKDGSEIVQTFTLYSIFSGWRSITSDGRYIYGIQTYQINQFDPQGGGIVNTFPSTNFSASGIAYDPQKEHFYLGNGVGAIKVIDKQGDEINFFVVPYEIEGLSWDSWSPGGPYLWAYYTSYPDSTIKAIRLNPNTCGPTGVEFDGFNMSTNPDFEDQPEGITVTPDWQENKLVMIGLHNSWSASGEDADQVVVYDLAVTPPPDWIELLPPSFGDAGPLETDTMYVRLKAIMEDTLMTAQVVINSNDVLNPKVYIPVNFRMLPQVFTGIADNNQNNASIVKNIFPNPASDIVTIEFNNEKSANEIQIFNTAGMLVRAVQVPLRSKQIDFSVSKLPSGNYQLQIVSESGVENQKLVVQ
jgi:hypothetical protein